MRRRRDPHDAGLRQLRLVAVAVPALFIAVVQVMRPFVFDRFWPRDGDTIVSTLTALASIAFGLMMFRLIAQLVEDDRYRSTVAERDRIARELHDSLAQVLGATNLRLQATLMHPGLADQPAIREELGDIARTCQESYGDVREAILGLREGPRTERTFVEGLESYTRTYSRSSGIETTVESRVDGEPALAPTAEVQVIRILQEALTNARKHSGARTARVVVSETADRVVLVVEDDGQGFAAGEVASEREGFGLHSMRERAELVGGRLRVDSAPGQGTRVTVEVPRGQRSTRLASVVPV